MSHHDCKARLAEDAEDVFEVSDALIVNNPRLQTDGILKAQFIKIVDDRKFVSLDFYKSRGVYTLYWSRDPNN